MLDGNVYITPTITKDVLGRMTGASKQGTAAYVAATRRPEADREGPTHKEIAGNLGLSTRTVEGYKYEMMETLGVTSTAELVRYALDRRRKTS